MSAQQNQSVKTFWEAYIETNKPTFTHADNFFKTWVESELGKLNMDGKLRTTKRQSFKDTFKRAYQNYSKSLYENGEITIDKIEWQFKKDRETYYRKIRNQKSKRRQPLCPFLQEYFRNEDERLASINVSNIEQTSLDDTVIQVSSDNQVRSLVNDFGGQINGVVTRRRALFNAIEEMRSKFKEVESNLELLARVALRA